MVSAKAAATIKSPKDWKGVSAGVTSIGSGTHTLMRAMAIKAGLQVSDVNSSPPVRVTSSSPR